MVKSWKEGEVKIDGIDFQVNEGAIVEVMGIPIEGIKFYRDKKISLSTVKEFAKNAKEKKDLVKN